MTPTELQALIDAQHWHFCKSMPKAPHWYIRQREFTDPALWYPLVTYIWNNAYEERWHRRTFRYCNIGAFKYWSMDPSIEETDLINRAELLNDNASNSPIHPTSSPHSREPKGADS